jgi:hypothetical protein
MVLPLAVHGADGSENSLPVVQASEILIKIQNDEPVEYDHVIVKGDLNLSQSRLQTNITSPIRINDSTFDGFVSFNYTNLDESIDLSGALSRNPVIFTFLHSTRKNRSPLKIVHFQI